MKIFPSLGKPGTIRPTQSRACPAAARALAWPQIDTIDAGYVDYVRTKMRTNMKSWCFPLAGLLLLAIAARLPAAESLRKDDPAWARSLNLLKMIQPEQNTVEGKWRMDGNDLLCEASGSARLEIPYTLPDEYDFRIKFTPISGRHEVRQILAKAGHQFLWSIGADGKPTYGFGLINGKKANENRTTIKNGPSLEPGVAYESIVQVRKDGLKAFLNGSLLAQWKTDYQDMSMGRQWEIHNKAWLGLGIYQGCIRFHRIDLLEVSGQGKAAVQPSAANTTRQTAPGTPAKTTHEPTLELANAAWTKAVHLMPMIDPAQDTVIGNWKKVNDDLIAQCERRGDAILSIPYEPPAEYDFRIIFTRSGGNGITQIITQGGRAAVWWMGGWGNKVFGFDAVDGNPADKNRTTVSFDSCLEDNHRYTSVLQVRKSEIKAFLDGKLITSWERKADYSDASLSSAWNVSNQRLLGIGIHRNTTTFHAIDVLEISGKGQKVAHAKVELQRRPPEAETAGRQTAEKTPSQTTREPAAGIADATLQKDARKFLRNQSSIRGLFVVQMKTGQRLGSAQDIIATLERTRPDRETIADFAAEIAKDTRISLDEAVRLLKVRYPVWEAGHRIRFSFGDKYTKQAGGSAGGAFAVLLLSLLEGSQIDPDFAMTGDVTVDGKIRKVGAVPEKIHGALLDKCKVVALPAANKDNLSDLVVLYGPTMLWQAQLFAVENLDQAAALARQDRAENLAKAMAQFAVLQKSLGPQATLTALNTPNRMQALQEVLKLAPNHLSAEFIMLSANGKLPTKLSLLSSLEETWQTAAPLLPSMFSEEEISTKKSTSNVEWHVPDEVFQTVNTRLTWLASRIHPKASNLHNAMTEYIASLKGLNRQGLVASIFARQQCQTKRDKLLGESLKLGADRNVLEELIH
jgi:hypothetical protein